MKTWWNPKTGEKHKNYNNTSIIWALIFGPLYYAARGSVDGFMLVLILNLGGLYAMDFALGGNILGCMVIAPIMDAYYKKHGWVHQR